MSRPSRPSTSRATGFSIDDVPSHVAEQPPRRDKYKNEHDYSAAYAAYTVRSAMVTMLDQGQVEDRVDMARVLNLRFSGLPFCSLRWFLSLPTSLRGNRKTDFGSRFFTSVGHTVHDVFQTAVYHSKSFQALNDYVCTSCKHRYVLRPEMPRKCRCGSVLFRREEHEVLWRGAIGHVDEIVCPVPSAPKKVFLLDYKTTSLKNINKADPIGYTSQIKSYAVSLTDAGYEILGCGLVYVPRDNPFKWRMSDIAFNPTVYKKHLAWMEFWLAEHAKGMAVETPKDALELIASRPCREKIHACYTDCQFAADCGANGIAHPPIMKQRVKRVYEEIKIWLPLNKQKE